VSETPREYVGPDALDPTEGASAAAAGPPREPSPAAIEAAYDKCTTDIEDGGASGRNCVREMLRAAYAVDGVAGVPPAPPDVSELQGILAQAIRQSERADKPGQGRVECIDFLMFATLVHATVWGPSDAPPA